MTDRVGQQLGNYRLISPLGQGGFAEVYLGEHVFLKTKAAIKVLHTQLTKDDMDSFLNEARTIANLIHPNIVRVLEFGLEGNTPFLVMDYAPNGTLRQRHPKGSRLPLPDIVSYVKQIADALQYAHDQKLVHRDVKPENMVIGRRSEVLLSDFGIALIAQSSRYQSTHEMAGTVAYMAPEQIQGKPRPASDQYALGIVVYEWISGEHPFHGTLTEIAVQHAVALPPPLHEKVPTILPDVEQVVMMALAKDSKQRFTNVQAFSSALEQSSQAEQPTFVKRQPRSLPPPVMQKPVASPPPSSSPQEASFSSSDSYPAEMEPVMRPLGRKIAATESKKLKVNAWKVRKRHIVAMIVGTVLYGILGSLYYYNIFSTTDSGAVYIILGGLMEVTILFFGAVFGPWVGFFTGEVGSIIVYIFASNIAAHHNIHLGRWDLGLSTAPVGFIVGFATLGTQGHYDRVKTIALAEGLSALAAVVGVALRIYTNLSFSSDSRALDPLILISSILGYIPSLILLPILLVLYNEAVGGYNAVVSRRKRA